MIKNIIFDFGGILYDIDYDKSILELSQFTPNKEKLEIDIIDLPSKFEKGLINAEQFRQEIISQYRLNCSNTQFDKAWNAMLLGIKPDAIEFISKIKKQFKIALLSNTNIIHYNMFYDESQYMIDMFDFKFMSFEIGMRKPDTEIYNYVLSTTGFIPEETLFFDDNPKNIIGSTSTKINSILSERNGNLSDILHSIEYFTQSNPINE